MKTFYMIIEKVHAKQLWPNIITPHVKTCNLHFTLTWSKHYKSINNKYKR